MELTEKKAKIALAAGIVAAGIIAASLISVLQGLGYNKKILDELSGRMKNMEAVQQRLSMKQYETGKPPYGQGSGNAPSASQIASMLKSIDSLREGRFNDMVDRVIKESSTDNERAIKMAGHICATVRNECGNSRHNYSKVELDAIADPLTAWEYRLGVCGWRAQILVRALARMNIKAQIFNIYDYAFGHSCVVATYGGKDHFLDPTYGGYFEGRDGEVMSWEQAAANPRAAMEAMRVFPGTLDCYQNGERVENASRMQDVYKPESMAMVRNAGALESRVFVLPVALDLTGIHKGPVVFGTENGSETDMRDDAVTKRTRCWYLDFLGYNLDKFAYSLNLTGLSGNRPVDVCLKFCKSGRGAVTWQASSRTGMIVAGAKGPPAGSAREWLITYQPGGEGPQSVEIRLLRYADKSWSLLDCIKVAKTGQIKTQGGEG